MTQPPTRPRRLAWTARWQTDPDYRAAALARVEPEDDVLHRQIIETVAALQAHLPAGYGVLPKYVQTGIPFDLAEFTLRRHMVTLWREGKLERMGGNSSRRGYRVAVERVETVKADGGRKIVAMPKIEIRIEIRLKVA